MKKIIKNLDDLKYFSHEIEKNIFWFSNILIYWEVWAWKTTFTQFFLENIWVKKKVKSPSYALENFYQIKNSKKFSKVWHYDIYRLENKNLESLENNFESDDLVIVERAEKLNKKPQSWIELHFKKISDSEREIEIKFFWTSLSEEQIWKIFNKYKTPLNIQWHTAQVANIAIQTAENLIKKWTVLDKKLIYTAAKLHDVVKYIDFVENTKLINWKYFDIFWKEIPEEIITFWNKIKKEFSWLDHNLAWWKLFYDLWFKEIWKVISSHWLLEIFNWFWTWEEKIVYYWDMRTVHHEKVSVHERMKDISERYWNWSEENKTLYKDIEEKILKLEKELI